MKKAINRSDIFQVKCNKCGAIINFNRDDMFCIEDKFYITCTTANCFGGIDTSNKVLLPETSNKITKLITKIF